MRRHIALAAVLAAAGLCTTAEASWIFRPSHYSHRPETGERVNQFAPEKPAYATVDPTYQRSGYRHVRGALEVGGSFDYSHTVETWGQGENIRPYGEWLYPYRAGATPFGPWGNPQGPWSLPFSPWFNPYGFGMPPAPWAPLPAVPGGRTSPQTAPPAVPDGSAYGENRGE